MGVGTRLKQLVMVTGVLTLLAGVAMLAVAVYLWWDSRQPSAGVDTPVDAGSETDVTATEAG